MTAAKKIISDKFLKRFVPLGDLDADQFNRVAKKSIVKQYEPGAKLFQLNDRDNKTIYLLSGQVILTFRSGTERIITADTNQALHALVPEQPRQATAVAKTSISVLVIDSDVLDQVLHWNQEFGYEISELEIDQDNDWMTMFLQSKAFLKLRAQNIQALMMKLEELPVKAGQVIVRQGEDDGYYYIVKRGKCRVTRKPPNSPYEIEIAVLESGSGFGEEALIMHDKRGATVTMMESGYLMRLSRQDFTRLLAEPLVQIVSYKDAVKSKASVFLDVRSYEEFVKDGIKHSENCPLPELRAKIQAFDDHKQYVVVSDHGGRASAAAFLLCQQGLNAVVLARGLAGLENTVARGNGDVQDLDQIPTVENVVNFNKDITDPEELENEIAIDALLEEHYQYLQNEEQDENELLNDPRVNAIFSHAESRVREEEERAKLAEQARLTAEQEVQRLRQEAEQAKLLAEEAKQKAEVVARESVEAARLEVTQEAARLRQVELGCKQAELEEAVKQAESEAKRAYDAEKAFGQAQSEIEKLKKEMQTAIENTEESARRSTQAILLFTQQESKRYKEEASKRAAAQARRVEQFEQACRQKEDIINQLKGEVDSIRRQIETQSSLSADVDLSDEEKQEANRRAMKLAKQQAVKEQYIEQLVDQLEKAIAFEEQRDDAEAEIEKLRQEAEQLCMDAAEQTSISVNQSVPVVEQEAALAKARELAEKQLEIEAMVCEREYEIVKAAVAEQARLEAQEEIDRVRQYEAEQRAAIELEAQRIAEEARKEAEHKAEEKRLKELAEKQAEIDFAEQRARAEAERARAAEEARVSAEKEITKLREEAEAAQEEIQERLKADIERSEMEHEVARVRAEELIKKQSELDDIASRAENESIRAKNAENASIEAEREINRLKMELQELRYKQTHPPLGAEEEFSETAMSALEESVSNKESEIEAISRRAEEEAERAKFFDAAYQEAQDEIARLKAEMDSESQQAREQLAADMKRAALEQAAIRQQARELELKQQEIERTIQLAQEEAAKAQQAIEERIKAEEEVEQLKAQAGMAYSDSEVQEMLRKSEEQAKQNLKRQVNKVRKEEAARHQLELEEAAKKAAEEARRAEIAEKARMEAEREIERLKSAAGVQRIRAEKAIKETIKTASNGADNNRAVERPVPGTKKVFEKQDIVNGRDSISDFFRDEPPTDRECLDEFNLLFTNIDIGMQNPDIEQSKNNRRNMSNDPEYDDEFIEPEKSDNSDPWAAEEPMSGGQWVSDQVMWETALGFRQDEKISTIISPEHDEPAPAPQQPAQRPPQQPVNRRPQQPPQQHRPQQHRPKQAPARTDAEDRSIFQGRDINPNLATQSVSAPSRRSRRQLLRKVKQIAVWALIASPFIAMAGYYFSLEKQERIDLQLGIANFFSGKSKSEKLSRDAAKLIEETESKMKGAKNTKSNSGKKAVVNKAATASKPAPKPKVVQEVVTDPNLEVVEPSSAPRTFEGRDLSVEEDVTTSNIAPPNVSAPEDSLSSDPLGSVPLPEVQSIAPPIPDGDVSVDSAAVPLPEGSSAAGEITSEIDSGESAAAQKPKFEHVPIVPAVPVPEQADEPTGTLETPISDSDSD